MTHNAVNALRVPGPLVLASRSAEHLEIVALSGAAVALPLVLQHPQFLVGTAVNFALVLAALQARSWHSVLPLVILPSVAAVAGGALFGATPGMGLLLLPLVIWLGNAFLAWVIRRVGAQTAGGHIASLAAGALGKALFILAGIAALVAAGLLPASFLAVMVPMQFATAMVGGLLAWPAGLAMVRWAGRGSN